jgi:tetratricopeptide (TPR) repeat protein
MGRWEEAVPLLKDLLEQTGAEHGKAGNEYLIALNNLATIYINIGRHDDAEPLYDEALSISRRVLGAEHPNTKIMHENYEVLLAEMKEKGVAGPK